MGTTYGGVAADAVGEFVSVDVADVGDGAARWGGFYFVCFTGLLDTVMIANGLQARIDDYGFYESIARFRMICVITQFHNSNTTTAACIHHQ